MLFFDPECCLQSVVSVLGLPVACLKSIKPQEHVDGFEAPPVTSSSLSLHFHTSPFLKLVAISCKAAVLALASCVKARQVHLAHKLLEGSKDWNEWNDNSYDNWNFLFNFFKTSIEKSIDFDSWSSSAQMAQFPQPVSSIRCKVTLECQRHV